MSHILQEKKVLYLSPPLCLIITLRRSLPSISSIRTLCIFLLLFIFLLLMIPKFFDENFNNHAKKSLKVEKLLSVEDRLDKRRRELTSKCKRKGLAGSEKYLVEELSYHSRNMFYLDKQKILYCAIPKVNSNSVTRRK